MRKGKLRLEGPCKEHEGDCYKQRKTLCKAPELERAWQLGNKNDKSDWRQRQRRSNKVEDKSKRKSQGTCKPQGVADLCNKRLLSGYEQGDL